MDYGAGMLLPNDEPLVDPLHISELTIMVTFWCPLLPYGCSYKASYARPG